MKPYAAGILAALLAGVAATPALAGSETVLASNRAATGGAAWNRPGTLDLDYAYAGQGLTGSVHTRYDLAGRGFVDTDTIGPQSGASGLDGTSAWEQESSGIVSDQKGGDVLPLAFNEAYRDGNLWWRAGQGGAWIDDEGTKTEDGATYDVLKVAPKAGKPFEAWFDSKTHFLARTIEVQGPQTITTFFSDYSPEKGFVLAHKVVIDDGTGAANRQTQTLRKVEFLPVQKRASFSAPKTAVHDFSIAGDAAETTVPFRLINNHIYANVSINGSKPHLFIFDTGGHSILTPDLAKTLGIRAQGSTPTTGGGSGFVEGGVTRVDSISVGGATVTNQPVTVTTFGPPTVEGVTEEGMVGYEFFARFVTRIDYGAHTLTFIDKKHFDPRDAGTRVPIVFYNQLPQLAGTYDGIPGQFCIDTGARTTLILNSPYVARHRLREQAGKGVEAQTGWGVGGPTYSFVTHGGVLRLGDVTVEHPLVMMSTDKTGADAAEAFPNNVGGGILKRFIVTLDYDHYAMYLKPIAGPGVDIDTFDRSGMWINSDPDGYKVMNVSKGTPAAEAGIEPGDIIVSVDGHAAGSMPLYDERQKLRDDPPGTVVALSIKRGADTRDVSLTLRDLI